MKHLDRTLQILQERKDKGIHSFQLNHLVGTTRSAARIKDLKDLGYVIKSMPEKFGDAVGVRYTLLSEPEVIKKIQPKYEFVGNTVKIIS